VADTNTPNIGLLLPDLNDTFNFGAHVENNFSTVDSMMGAVSCTSSTRPSNTYKGQIIYEVDSARYAQNTGSKASPVWTYMSHAALAVTAASRPTSGLSVGETIYETDTTRLLVYNGSSWENKAFSNLSVTSSTHPTSANSSVGEQIFETDTFNSQIWDGTAWRNIQTGPWTAYTPTWTASGTAPARGNGTLQGSYSKTGRTVHVRIALYAGSTTTFGTGDYKFSLPFAANVSGVPANALSWAGAITVFNGGNSTFYTPAAMIAQSQPSTVFGLVNGSASFWGQSNPAAISGSTTAIVVDITYESAS